MPDHLPQSIPIFDLLTSISDAQDLVFPDLPNHHRQVSYIAGVIGRQFGLAEDQLKDLMIAGILHDVGALSLQEKASLMNFELNDPWQHAKVGYLLLKMFEPFAMVARLVRFHHQPWNQGDGANSLDETVPLGSHILMLADRIAIQVKLGQDVLEQAPAITQRILERRDDFFHPEMVEAFLSVSGNEAFWLDIVFPSLPMVLRKMAFFPSLQLSSDELLNLSNLFRRLIDFRNPFTATHTSGVAATAEILSKLRGWSDGKSRLMRFAGNIHDLGKLAVPSEVLQKPGALSPEEVRIMRRHTYYTYRVLQPVQELEEIAGWGAYHHERLDGSGYPFHLRGEQISEEARIMAVADIFTAITEDRPYRAGMTKEQSLKTLWAMVKQGAIDGDVVALLESNFPELDAFRKVAQQASIEEYRLFIQQLSLL